MTIVKIEPQPEGLYLIQSQSHRTEVWEEGYVAVPPGLEDKLNGGWCELTIEDGVLTGVTPATGPIEERTPAEERKWRYENLSVIEFRGQKHTVNGAVELWTFYSAEGDHETAAELEGLIHEQKDIIRAEVPD
jgi:hypothetical protein